MVENDKFLLQAHKISVFTAVDNPLNFENLHGVNFVNYRKQ